MCFITDIYGKLQRKVSNYCKLIILFIQVEECAFFLASNSLFVRGDFMRIEEKKNTINGAFFKWNIK